MPSASNVKLETKPSSLPAEINHQSQPVAVVTAPHHQHQPEPPIRQVLVLIEHKIRNLEKRKGKLDSYKDSQKSGKDLTSDQLIAVSKYDEVTHLLEFAREFVKQINNVLAASEKEQKKIARREASHRTQQDIGKVREVFVFQNILEQFKVIEIRQDFVNGSNGAIKLDDQDFELLDKLLVDVTPIRGENDDAKKFAATAQKSAEIMFHVVDGRTKPYHGDITFEKVRALIQSIISSEYFDRQPEIVEEEIPVNGIESDVNTNETGVESLSVEDQNGQEKYDGSDDLVKDDGIKESLMNSADSTIISEAPAPTSVPVPSFPPSVIPLEQTQTIPSQSQVPIQQIVTTPVTGVNLVPANQIPPHIGPTTVRAVEQAYFKQHQYLQQIRPIAEVIGSGSFFFLQDSELDSPDPFPNVGFQPAAIINNNIQHSPTGQQQPPQQQQSPQQPSPQQQQQQQPVQVTQQQPAPPNQIPNKGQPPQQQQLINASIQTQTFTNQNFKAIVPTQQPAVVPYGQIKNSDINPAHIPGFATVNNQIPVALSPAPQLIQNPVHIIAPAPAAVPIPGFVSPQQFVAPPNMPQQILNHPQQQQSQPLHPQQPKDVQQPQIVGETKKIIEESPPPKIENWNPNDANPQKDTSNEWQEVSKSDRREDKDSSNSWNEQNQDNSGYSNRNMSRNVRSGGGNMQSRQSGPRGPPSNNPNGNYHPRSQNAFQSGQTQQNTGRPNSNNNNGNTYFRNNDNYYQVQNGGGSNGNFLNSRQDNGYNNGQYKPRPHMSGGGGGNMRGNGNPGVGGGGGGGGQMRNNAGAGNMIDRNNPQHVPRTNPQNPGANLNANRGGNPGGPNMRPSQRGGGGGSNAGGPNGNYGGNTRPGPPPNTNQNSRTSQGINV